MIKRLRWMLFGFIAARLGRMWLSRRIGQKPTLSSAVDITRAAQSRLTDAVDIGRNQRVIAEARLRRQIGTPDGPNPIDTTGFAR